MTSYGTTEPFIQQGDIILTEAERDLLQADRPGYGSRSKIECAFNLVNSTVGAGIIGLPFAIYLAGFWLGIVLSIFVSILCQLGLHMLVVSGQRLNTYKFADLMEDVLGSFGYYFLNFLILVQAGGASVSYFILIGDTIPVLLQLYFPQYPSMTDRSLVISLIAILFVFPLNLSRSIGAVARWSILSVLCLPVIIIALLIRAPAYTASHEAPMNWVGPDIFGALGILAFAFSCTHVCFSVYLSLTTQSTKAWTITCTLASVMTWVVSMSFAIIGYLSFGKDVQPNLFLNFPNDDVIVNIGRFTLGFSMILTIPMGFYPTREAVQKLLGFETKTHQPTQTQHYIVTILLFILITVLGIYVRSLGKVYTLIGGFAGTCLAYILPAAACLISRRRPAVAGVVTSAIIDTESAKTPLLHKSHSSSSSTIPKATEEDILFEQVEEIPIVLDDSIPSFGLLDCTAVVLLIWGLVVMFFATVGSFK